MRRIGGVVALVLALAACGSSGGAEPGRPGTSVEYRPGLGAQVDRPTGEPTMAVVLVPGGGWASADPSGLAPLADALAASGAAVVTITYGTSGSGARFPEPADDVACAVAYTATQVPGVPVVLMGHSAGAHLAALVGLVPQRAGGRCPSPAHAADVVVGLAGPYDVTRLSGVAVELFGVAERDDPDLWAEGNPLTWVDQRPEVPFLLVHGDADQLVPPVFTEQFADALLAGGHDVSVELVAGADHLDVFRPEVVGDLVSRWLADATAGPTSQS